MGTIILGKGKKNALTLLLDYNEEKMMNIKHKNGYFQEALIYFDTLGNYFMTIFVSVPVLLAKTDTPPPPPKKRRI